MGKKKPPKSQVDYYNISIREVWRILKSDKKGLSKREVKKRQKKFGSNQLKAENNFSAFKIFIKQLVSPLVYVLIGAAIISLVMGEMIDFVIIIIAIFVNTLIGFWQEYKADKTISKLRKLIQYHINVIRGSKQQRVLVEELVPGDVILLQAGDKVPADARIVMANGLQINESSLTGESFPVNKNNQVIKKKVTVGDRLNMVFMGTNVTAGTAQAIVTEIGENTQIGKIAFLVKNTEEEKTPLQVQMVNISKYLTWLVLIIILFILIIGVYRQIELVELLTMLAALAVAAIPEGLLVGLTVVLVIGMHRILKHRALVRQLNAAETLGSVSVICSDKTGTLTKGVMEVSLLSLYGDEIGLDFINSQEIKEKNYIKMLETASFCNNSCLKNQEQESDKWEFFGDPTENALLSAAFRVGLKDEVVSGRSYRLDEIPFKENYKYMATLYGNGSEANRVYVKGAPETVMSMSSYVWNNGRKKKFNDEVISSLQKQYENLTKKGLRVLAVAQKNVDVNIKKFNEISGRGDIPKLNDLIFLGFIGLKDPVRGDVRQAIDVIRKAGIKLVIITGDHKFTAKSVIEELGIKVLESQILEGKNLAEMTDQQLFLCVENIVIYARVEPQHKLRIVKAWQQKNQVVAMFGDGINDAPALKAADIGVVVDSGSDVAKETADMILLDSNFGVIQSAIKQGRVIFENIRKIFLYLISDSFTEAVIISGALLIGYPIPLLAIQILWINIASDGLLHLALTMEPAEKDVMVIPPRNKSESIANREVKLLIAAISSVAVCGVFGLFTYLLANSNDLQYIRTIIFSAFSIDSMIYVLSVKSLRNPIWRINLFNNIYLIAAIVIGIILQFFIVYAPFMQKAFKTVSIGVNDWLLIFTLGVVEILVIELIKYLYWRKPNKFLATQT